MSDTGNMDSPLRVVDGDGVRSIIINRPDLKNALNDECFEALRTEFLKLRIDRSVRAVVLRGAGGDFSSGADMRAQRMDAHPLDRMSYLSEVVAIMQELPQPLIAQVEGVAVGAGLSLLLACDLSVATPSSRFSAMFSRRGLSPDFGASWFLPRAVGVTQAKRLLLLSEFIDGGEAVEIGLVTWLRAEDLIEEFVEDLALRLAAGPPVAISQTRALLQDGMSSSLRQSLTGEARAQVINQATDGPLARRAYAEGAPPVFTGVWNG